MNTQDFGIRASSCYLSPKNSTASLVVTSADWVYTGCARKSCFWSAGQTTVSPCSLLRDLFRELEVLPFRRASACFVLILRAQAEYGAFPNRDVHVAS